MAESISRRISRYRKSSYANSYERVHVEHFCMKRFTPVSSKKKEKRGREAEREKKKMRKFSFRLTSISGHPEREKEGERKRQGDVVLRDLRSYEHPTPAPFPRVCIRNVSPFAPKSRNNIACSRREVFDTSPEVLPRGLPRDGIKRSRYEAACTRNTLYSRCAQPFSRIVSSRGFRT